MRLGGQEPDARGNRWGRAERLAEYARLFQTACPGRDRDQTGLALFHDLPSHRWGEASEVAEAVDRWSATRVPIIDRWRLE